jgi:hypothetical protein
LREANNELIDLRNEIAKLSNQNKLEVLNKSRQSINTLDDLESVETASIPNKANYFLVIFSNFSDSFLIKLTFSSKDIHFSTFYER